MFKFFKKPSIYNLLLFVFLFGVLISALVIWIVGGKEYSDFGLNLFTEMLGVLITIFVIDYLVKRREYKKQLPINASIYKDTFEFFGKFITIFHSSYIVSVPDELPETLEGFISKDGMGKVFKYLDLNTKPRITPERTWYTYYQERHNSILMFGNTFLERYKGFTEPEIFNAIHTLINGKFLGALKMMPTIMKVQRSKNSNYIMSFESFHVHFSDKEYQSLNILNNWIKKSYSKLKKFDDTIPKYIFKTELHVQDLTCKLPDEYIKQ